jgi:hypothetical protein
VEDPHDKLKRHVEMMADCMAWALKAQEAIQEDDRVTADRYLKRAESYLEAVKELEPQLLSNRQ